MGIAVVRERKGGGWLVKVQGYGHDGMGFHYVETRVWAW